MRELATGSERVTWPDLDEFIQPRWSPDGRRLLVRGRDRKGKRGGWLLDPTTGTVISHVVDFPLGWDIEWSRDSLSLFAITPRFVGRVNAETGEAQEFYRDKNGRTAGSIAVAPDGQMIALTLDSKQTRTLVVLSVSGGPAREIMSLSDPDVFELQSFTADGASLLFTRRTGPAAYLGQQDWSLWRVSVSGGPPQEMNLSDPNLRGVKVSPDGTRIAYRTGEPEWDYWVMRNFLP